MRNLVAYFVERPVIPNLLMVLVFFVGAMVIGGMRYEYNPKVDMGRVNITTMRAGAGPEEVELSITLPLEEELLKVEGIKKIKSRSMEGLSLIVVKLDIDVGNKRKTLNDIQKAVDRAQARLPDDLVEKPLVEEQSTLLTPVAEVHVTGNVPEGMLRRVARNMEDGLREVKGVSSVRKVGYRRPEVKIHLEHDKQVALGISIGEIVDAIQRRNVRDSGGSLSSFLSEKKVVTVGQFSDPKEVENVIIRSAEPGNAVKLRDIASVVLDYEDWELQSRTDGQPSIALMVRKQERADELHTARYVRDFVEQSRPNLPPGVELKVVNDISRLTVNALEILVGNAALGFVLVFFLLCYFLNLRFAMWVAVGIPFAIALTFLMLAGVGITINAMSLTAIILLMGILVDDAVVVSENTQRLRETHMSPRNASITGASEVAAPVIFSALTTAIAFAPLLFMKGEAAAFMDDFSIAVIILLLASLLESQLILPSHLAEVKKIPEKSHDAGFRRLQERYHGFIQHALTRRYRTLGLFVGGFFLVLVFGAMTISAKLYPDADIDTVFVKVELPTGSRFEQTVSAVEVLEEELWQRVPLEDVLNITAQVGHHNTDMYGAVEGNSEAWALIAIYLKPVNEREANTFVLVDELREWAAAKSGFESLVVEAMTDVPVQGKPIELEVISNGEERFTVANDLLNWLKQHPGVADTWTSYSQGKDIVDLNLKHELLAARGLTVEEVIQTVRVAVDGLQVEELQTLDERVRYRLQLPPVEAARIESLESLSIINDDGKAIYLKSVADFDVRPGEADIKHYLGKRTVTVYGELNASVSVNQMHDEVMAYLADKNWPAQYPDLRYWYGGEYEQTKEAMEGFGDAYLVALLSIFALLIMLFGSVTQPLLIMICIPFGLTGVIIGFGLQGLDMGMMAMTGIIGLIGVLVNDSLVMVHKLNNLRHDKGDFLSVEDIASIARQRFRPILITSTTTLVGLLPTAYGILGENSYITPMVMAMAWGVLFGGLVSLILLPCLYGADQDIRKRLGHTI